MKNQNIEMGGRFLSVKFNKKALLTLFALFFFGIGVATAQIQVRGVVIDEYGDGVIGATVRVQGTTIGTATDATGNFTISAPAGSTLIVGFLGYVTQYVAAAPNLRIYLVPDATLLDDVVVTALGIRRETRALGYAVSRVRGEELLRVGLVTNPLQALYGVAAGVGIQATAGGPMGGIQIRVRGAQGLDVASNARPLFVIDGVPMFDNESHMGSRHYDPLNSFDMGSAVADLNPEDIESIEILRGAKASILYGSQGANGVVLITTRSGAGTRGLGVTVSYGFEVEVPTNLIRFQNEFGSGLNHYAISFDAEGRRRLVSHRSNFGPRFDGSPIYGFDGVQRPYQAIRDNYMALFQRGSHHITSAAISGGNDRGHMRISLTNSDYTGTMPNQAQVRNTLSFNGQMQASDFARFEFIQNFTQTRAQNRRPNIQQLVSFGAFNRDYDIQSAIDMYITEDGWMQTNLGNIEPGWGWPQAFTDPGGLFPLLWNQKQNRNLDNRIQSSTSLTADLRFLPFMSLRLQGAINYNDTEIIRRARATERLETGELRGGQFRFARDRNVIQRYQAILTFDRDIAPDWNLTAFAGGVYQRSDFTHVGVGTMGNFLFPDFWTLQNSDFWPAGPDDRIRSYSIAADAIYTVLGQVLFSFRDTYYFEFQAANDWASTLPRANRSYFYPGASFTWVFTEDFNIPFMDIGRFRLSWADVGRPAPRYFALRTYTMRTLPPPHTHINDVVGPSDLFAGDLRSERRREWETGFNVQMFNRRAEVDLAYYRNVNYNEIMRVPLSGATGATNIRINAGSIQRQGLELALNVTPIRTQSVDWSVRFNFARQWDKILELHPGVTQMSSATFGIHRVDAVGERMGNLWMQDYLRDSYGNRVVGANGLFLLNNEPDGRIKIGNIFPDFFGGLMSQVGFRGRWGEAVISAGLDYRYGGQVLSMSNALMTGNGLLEETLRFRDASFGGLPWVDAEGRSRNDGVILPGVRQVIGADGQPIKGAFVPNDIIVSAQAYYGMNINDMRNSWFPDMIQDNNYIKLRDVSVAYTFPRRISQQLGLQRLTVSAQARNLLYIYKSINHIDAEAMLGTGVGNNWIENSSFPMSRFFGFRVNVAF